MKFLTHAKLAELTGCQAPAEQMAALREFGLRPFPNRRTGRPMVTAAVIEQAMIKKGGEEFVPNLDAFR